MREREREREEERKKTQFDILSLPLSLSLSSPLSGKSWEEFFFLQMLLLQISFPRTRTVQINKKIRFLKVLRLIKTKIAVICKEIFLLLLSLSLPVLFRFHLLLFHREPLLFIAPLILRFSLLYSRCTRYGYGVATISRLHKNIVLFCRIQVSFVGLFCKRDLYF